MTNQPPPARPDVDALYTAELCIEGKYKWCIVRAQPRVETVIQEFGFGPDAYRAAEERLASLRATSPAREAAKDAVKATTQYEFPYQQTFDAIAAATDVLKGPPQSQLSISVRKFQSAFNRHRDARPLAPPKPALDAVREALPYASTNQIAACRCGSFPRLYGDGARPDDGYRSLWCQTCMEHVAEMKPSEQEVIDYWNDLREREHVALSAPVPPADGAPIDEDTPYWRALRAALSLSVEDQHKIATDLAANCGYELTGDAYTRPSAIGAAEPDAWMCRSKGKNQPWDEWLPISNEEKNKEPDDFYIYEYRPLYAIPPVRGGREKALQLLQASSCFRGEVCTSLPCACAESLADLSLPVQPSAGEREAARILRGWAKAYRESPEHRFPSDPAAEFFPFDLECAADLLAPLSATTDPSTKGDGNEA